MTTANTCKIIMKIIPDSSKSKDNMLVGWLVGYTLSYVGYLMPNPVYISVEMIDYGEFDNMIEICGKLDKSNT